MPELLLEAGGNKGLRCGVLARSLWNFNLFNTNGSNCTSRNNNSKERDQTPDDTHVQLKDRRGIVGTGDLPRAILTAPRAGLKHL